VSACSKKYLQSSNTSVLRKFPMLRMKPDATNEFSVHVWRLWSRRGGGSMIVITIIHRRRLAMLNDDDGAALHIRKVILSFLSWT